MTTTLATFPWSIWMWFFKLRFKSRNNSKYLHVSRLVSKEGADLTWVVQVKLWISGDYLEYVGIETKF